MKFSAKKGEVLSLSITKLAFWVEINAKFELLDACDELSSDFKFFLILLPKNTV